jgi:hypothetical protein
MDALRARLEAALLALTERAETIVAGPGSTGHAGSGQGGREEPGPRHAGTGPRPDHPASG